MSDLLKAQLEFFILLAKLFNKAVELNLPLKLGRALCCANCSGEKSLHRISLGLDLPMIWPDGRYGSWEDYRPLGEYWESLSQRCSWGGRFDLNGDGVAKDDANHFSYLYQGRR